MTLLVVEKLQFTFHSLHFTFFIFCVLKQKSTKKSLKYLQDCYSIPINE